MKKVILIGSGGHALSIMALKSHAVNKVVAYADIKPNPKFELKYVGNDNDVIRTCSREKYNILIGLSYIDKHIDLELRKEMIALYKNYDFHTIIAASSIIKKYVIIGNGTVIFEKVFINTHSTIGANCVVNTGSIIEHNCILNDNVQIGPKVIVCGGVEIGKNSFVAAGSVIRDSVRIVDNVIVGLGSVVVNDLVESGMYFGCPAKRIR
jgi:UDP-perosamine 4-acetyltransferase